MSKFFLYFKYFSLYLKQFDLQLLRINMINKQNPTENLGTIINVVSRMMINDLNKRFQKAGFSITVEQWVVLMILWKKEGQTQQELADALFKNKATMTSIIDNLEKNNLVVRISDKADRRANMIHLTYEGKQLKSTLIEIAQESLKEALTGIDTNDYEICKSVLKQIAKNISSNTEIKS